MEFWILDEDLSINLDKLNPEEPFDFVSVFYYGMPTGDRSKALEIFKSACQQYKNHYDKN